VRTTTVIMPAYNAESSISRSIESVQAQSYDDWKMIVVNDGSHDQTAQIVRKFVDSDDRIILLNQKNAGVAAARHAGITKSDTEFISLLDSDDSWDKDYLKNMLSALTQDQSLSLAVCDAFICDPDGSNPKLYSSLFPMAAPVTLERVAMREFHVFTSVTMRRSCYLDVGGYNKSLKRAEDFDLWLRVLAAGAKATFINKPMVNYCSDDRSLSADKRSMQKNTLEVYDNFIRSYPEMTNFCFDSMRAVRYNYALISAKIALKEKKYDDFFSKSKDVFENGENFKLQCAVNLAKFSPTLAHTLFTWREST